jgi:hypothetical protein
MTRTFARRLATVGGALGIAVLACAGTASADASDSHAPAGDTLVTNIGNEVGNLHAWGSHTSSGDTLVTNIGNEVGSVDVASMARGADGWGDCPCPPPPPPPPCRPCPPPPCPPGWGWHHDHHDGGPLEDLLED